MGLAEIDEACLKRLSELAAAHGKAARVKCQSAQCGKELSLGSPEDVRPLLQDIFGHFREPFNLCLTPHLGLGRLC